MDSFCYLALFVTIIFSNIVIGIELPSRYERCQVSPELDNKPNECLKRATTSALKELTDTGTPELEALAMDPMQIKHIKIQRGTDSPVAITLVFKNNTLYGLSGFSIQEFNGKLSSPQGFKAVVHASTPSIQLTGPYKISGKVLILPINGEGLSNMTFKNVKAKILLIGEPKTANGKEYLSLTSWKMSLEIGRMIVSFQNLFNGNKELGDNMNSFINQNWKDIYNELRPSIEEAFSAVFLEYAKNVFDNVPFANIFIVQ